MSATTQNETTTQPATMLSVFQHPEFTVRGLVREGEPWFVAKDVCHALGLKNSRQVVDDHLDEDELSDVRISDTRSSNGVIQSRSMTVVSESGVYALIFQSRKPEARAFRKYEIHRATPVIPSLSFSLDHAHISCS
jgi:prophage antirepressor-like protein